MDKQKEYGSRFLFAEDLLSKQRYVSPTVEISEIHPPGSLTSANGQKIGKLTVSFKGRAKMLVLCKTNEAIIAIVTGEREPAAWVGKKVTLQVRIVPAFGQDVAAIRVIPPKGTILRKGLADRLGRKAEFVAESK